jgi:prevent-host-death family protein
VQSSPRSIAGLTAIPAWTKLSLVMNQVNIHQAKTQLSRLLELAANGEEIIIAKAGKPVARLVPYAAKGTVRRPGIMRGKIRIKKNFDEPLPEKLLVSFEGKS